MTLDYSILKKNDVIYIYSFPPEKSIVGVITDIDKKIIYIKTIKREAGDTKNGEMVKVDLKEVPPITILNDKWQKKFLTTSELKRLKEVQKQPKEESEQILWD